MILLKDNIIYKSLRKKVFLLFLGAALLGSFLWSRNVNNFTVNSGFTVKYDASDIKTFNDDTAIHNNTHLMTDSHAVNVKPIKTCVENSNEFTNSYNSSTNGINGIDEILMIAPNDMNSKRYEYIQMNEKATGLKFKYLYNTDAKSPLVRTYQDKHGFKLKRGKMALRLSHFSSWKYIVDNKLKNAIILEDDVEMDRNFKSLVEDLMPFIQLEHPDILLLGHCNTQLKSGKLPIIPVEKKLNCLHTYLVTYKGASKLLKHLYKEGNSKISKEMARLATDESIGYLNSKGYITVWALRDVITRQLSRAYLGDFKSSASGKRELPYQPLKNPTIISNEDAKKVCEISKKFYIESKMFCTLVVVL
jgi:hypothetical protein